MMKNQIFRTYYSFIIIVLMIGCSACSERKLHKNSISKNNRVYLYNMSGEGGDLKTGENGSCSTADMIIIESNGHFGLINSGGRFDDSIVDKDGREYSVPNVDKNGYEWALTSQIENKNAKDAVDFLL